MKKILIIEDDADILELLEIILHGNGFAVIKVNREITVKEIIGLSPHLIIIDLLLPFISGNELCLELKANKQTLNIPVILCSAHNNLERIAAESKSDAFISKPFDVIDFENLVKKLVL